MQRVVTVTIAGRPFDVTLSQRERGVWVAVGEFADREIVTMDRSFDGAVDRWRANALESGPAALKAA